MLELAERFIIECGALRVESDVAKDAIGFYIRCGYHYVNSRASPGDAVQMFKNLRVA
jgi:hypothetical protein